MGFRFRKSIKIAPGVKLNFNKKSTGITFGGKGLHYTVNSNGKKTTSVGVPGTGLYYTSTSGGGNAGFGNGGSNGGGNHYGNNYNMPSGGNYGGGNNYNNNYTPPQKPQKNYTKITILLLIFFFPLGLYFMWSKTSWNKIVKIIISVFIGIYCLFFAVVLMADDSSSLPASSSGITEIYCYEDTIRLDIADSLQDHKTIDYHFRTANASDDLLKSDFVIVFADESIADAEVNYITDYANEVQITVKALNAGTTTMHVETIDGTIKSDEITVEVIGEKPAYSRERDSTTETRSETTTETTTKETTTRETTTEETTKDTSRTVYITPTGKKYHYSKSCAGDNAMERTLNEVKDRYEPCKKCAP